jgi:hypothetical protein
MAPKTKKPKAYTKPADEQYVVIACGAGTPNFPPVDDLEWALFSDWIFTMYPA